MYQDIQYFNLILVILLQIIQFILCKGSDAILGPHHKASGYWTLNIYYYYSNSKVSE